MTFIEAVQGVTKATLQLTEASNGLVEEIKAKVKDLGDVVLNRNQKKTDSSQVLW